MKLLFGFRRRRPLAVPPRPLATKPVPTPQQQAQLNYDRMHRADMVRERRSVDSR